jgi:hypothetical protein
MCGDSPSVGASDDGGGVSGPARTSCSGVFAAGSGAASCYNEHQTKNKYTGGPSNLNDGQLDRSRQHRCRNVRRALQLPKALQPPHQPRRRARRLRSAPRPAPPRKVVRLTRRRPALNRHLPRPGTKIIRGLLTIPVPILALPLPPGAAPVLERPHPRAPVRLRHRRRVVRGREQQRGRPRNRRHSKRTEPVLLRADVQGDQRREQRRRALRRGRGHRGRDGGEHLRRGDDGGVGAPAARGPLIGPGERGPAVAQGRVGGDARTWAVAVVR